MSPGWLRRRLPPYDDLDLEALRHEELREHPAGIEGGVGDVVLVGGTTAIDPSGAVIGETPYEQAVEILRKIEHELGRVGAALTDVVQIRAYVTDISRSEDVGRAHGAAFAEVRPLMTMVEVSGLIDPRMLVELEAVAVLP
jgi:enamine deaminase RidA (YjgF/YER057c/UK114 family)